MMNAWETEDEMATAAQASLPTPTDTPYRTPSHTSRRSSRRKSISPAPSSSPPPLPHGEGSRRNSKDVTTDETISILDPRRFTPTLHASLVSEILSLRRDQEEKTRTIENLEANLHSSRGEYESLAATLSVNAKETRSLKRQLALLEGGTSSALGELARERDEAVDSVAEFKRRLEATQKKVRAQEGDADRVHELWNRDKDTWEDEKRKFERRVHAAEGRLKAVLEEVAAYQAAQRSQHLQNGDSEAEDLPRENGIGRGSDTASVRSMSLTNSIRFSLLNGPNGYGVGKVNGVSLADELDLDEDDETDHDGRDSVMSNHRTQSRESMLPRTHHRNQSIDSLRRPGSVARGRLLAMDKLQIGIVEGDESAPEKEERDQSSKPQLVFDRSLYVDVGIQYTPPTSPTSPEPKIIPIKEVALAAEKQVKQPYVGPDWEREIEANQRRKRVHASSPLIIEPGHGSMVSAASQTLEDPLSPPRTPKSPTGSAPCPPITVNTVMKSSFTQTDLPEAVLPQSAIRMPPIPIPSISIHPPTSRPATPKEPLLPQHFKDVACQVSLQVSVPCRSISVQTEEIRVDQRINLLPKHLQPSTISSAPPSPSPSPEPQMPEKGRFSPISIALPPRNPKRMKSTHSIKDIPSHPQLPSETHDTYPVNNDDGPLANSKGSLRRPHRSSSLFAGFEGVSSDEADDFADADLSDSDFRTALSAPKPKSALRAVRRTSVPPTSVPEDAEPVEEKKPRQIKSSLRQVNYDSNGIFTLPDAPAQKSSVFPGGRQLDKPLSVVTLPKSSTMRRAALISNGIAAHQVRSRSPSLPEAAREPPFPIPTRASSRKPPFSISAPSDGNRSPTRDSWIKHARRGSSRGVYRANSIRKVRSAAAIPANAQRYRRHGSRSPPPLSASTEAPESPQLPPMPTNDITSPELHGAVRFGTHRQQPSTNTVHTSNTGGQSIGSTQATSVVDAIAQTMVGEWMFKYVRRRKSFGVPDNGGPDGETGANGVRHKRWVWLAPYERAVMWSSKQPTSGSALMGKSGRKLIIQSVLDVKDDNPSPKGTTPLFNRSILILTPARALKFTATTRERHYVWLTALSFLAHSSQAVPDIMAISSPPAVPDFELPRPPGRLRKHPGIRDSIRVAKGKAYSSAATRSGPTSVHSSQQGGELSIHTDNSTRGERASEHSQSAKELNRFFTPEAADPPVVPRFTDRSYPGGHGRKRSNTGSRVPPPLSFRGFSERGPLPPVSSTFSTNGGGSNASHSYSNGNSYGGSGGGHNHAPSTAGISVGTNGSSDVYQSQNSGSVAGYGMSVSGRSSVRTSDASARPSAVVGNFFDAVGTMRMEAFISPLGMNRFDDFPDEMDEAGMVGFGKQHSREMLPRRSRESRRRSRHQDSFYSGRGGKDDWYGGSRTAGEEEYGVSFSRERDDPFRGF